MEQITSKYKRRFIGGPLDGTWDERPNPHPIVEATGFDGEIHTYREDMIVSVERILVHESLLSDPEYGYDDLVGGTGPENYLDLMKIRAENEYLKNHIDTIRKAFGGDKPPNPEKEEQNGY